MGLPRILDNRQAQQLTLVAEDDHQKDASCNLAWGCSEKCKEIVKTPDMNV
jgi:hypothetical protein